MQYVIQRTGSVHTPKPGQHFWILVLAAKLLANAATCVLGGCGWVGEGGGEGWISGSRRSASLAKRVLGEEPLPTSRFRTDMAGAWPGVFFVAWLHFRLL